jgi:salicylate synthetase
MRAPDELCLGPVDDPLTVAVRLASAAGFDSYVVYETPDQTSFAGGVLGLLTIDHAGVHATWNAGCSSTSSADPYIDVDSLLHRMPLDDWTGYGWAAFELGCSRPTGPGDPPLLYLAIPEVEVRMDARGTVIRAPDSETLHRLAALVADPTPISITSRRVAVRHETDSAYQKAVEVAVDEIRAGLLHKVILSRTVPIDEPVDLVATYLAGRRANSPARSFLLATGDLSAAGFSPETVAEIDPDRRLTTRLLAGTRPRRGEPIDDARLRDELRNDPKEITEHAISLKALHDDVERLVHPGTAAVTGLMAVVERGSVQHLESTLTGVLADHLNAFGAFGRLLPPAPVTGVPRHVAAEAIGRYEHAPRGLYGGAVFTYAVDGSLDAALVLRSVFTRAGQTWLQAGAGITAWSEPEREHAETRAKLDSIAPHLVPAT